MNFELTKVEWADAQKKYPPGYTRVTHYTLLKWHMKKGSEATLANLVSVLASSGNEDAELIQEIIDHFKCKFTIQGTVENNSSNNLIMYHKAVKFGDFSLQ